MVSSSGSPKLFIQNFIAYRIKQLAFVLSFLTATVNTYISCLALFHNLTPIPGIILAVLLECKHMLIISKIASPNLT